jgi:hypothetical protein
VAEMKAEAEAAEDGGEFWNEAGASLDGLLGPRVFYHDSTNSFSLSVVA